ncbi:hypothetical protein LPU83_pLPU83b_0100 (plasmid) [Rhizobium favelukesii]|uniref:Uncharacterized protein n=1 Tax=Rhizobium favelukesii TaxID=348824 RepID=W6RH13_9HYPH|nr:AAA family ATPase [Rhizobium favelukesii]CDM60099.1 hypothetical protein LPU83_pLPU83b_0100 [Rhizobium favelukesii]
MELARYSIRELVEIESEMIRSAEGMQAWSDGAALPGKAAEGLEESSGIKSRTLALWSRSWENPHSGDHYRLNRGDVFGIDKAGMVSSWHLAGFVGEAEARGGEDRSRRRP